jgi:O-antigen ligase
VYPLAAGLAIVAGASLPRAAERVGLGYLAIATAVALYALAGKTMPWLVDDAGELSRLREPLGYWNALALFCALAVPVALRAALTRPLAAAALTRPLAAPTRPLAAAALTRPLAAAALVPLIAATVLSLSRGGVAVLIAAVAAQVALAEDRRRLLAVAGVALLAALPALALGLTLPDLTTDGVPRGARVDDGLILLAQLAAGAVAAAIFAGRVARGARTSDPARVWAAAALVVAALVLVGGAALSERGLASGERSAPGAALERLDPPDTDPVRLLRTGSGNRWAWWGEALGAWSDRPLAGHGAGSFALLHRRYRDRPVDVREAHSLPLGLLAETGLIGAVLALGGLALLGIAATRGALGRADRRERDHAVALLAGAGAWALHGLVDWDWTIPAVTLPALVFAGVLAARPPGEPAPPRRVRPSTSPGHLAHAAGLAAGVALLCAAAVAAVMPALARDRADDAAFATPTLAAAERAEEAARLDPVGAAPLLAGATVAERRRRWDRAADLLLEAARRQPENPEVWMRLGRLQFLFGDAPGALAAAERGLALDPYDPQLALLAVRAGIDERASASATGTPLPEVAAPAGAP